MYFQAPVRSQQAFSFICNWLLPLGYLSLLVGLAALPDRSLYHKLFYALVGLPALIALLLKPGTLRVLLREPIILLFLAFSAWSLLSVTWSDTDSSVFDLLKRPLYIFMLFSACALLSLQASKRLEQTTLLGALLMLPLTVYSLSAFALAWTPGMRMIGSGALDNPLLSSHIFGFFGTLWLALSMTLPRHQSWVTIAPALVSVGALMATGSRTPLVAMSLACVWLTVVCWNRRSIVLIATGTAGLVALLLLYPDALLERGTSSRIDIWQIALGKILQQPWLGFGFQASLVIDIAGFPIPFSEPHSFALGVLYYTGIVGLTIWLAMHALALSHCWRNRNALLFVIAGSLLIYGLGAGLTEGGGILSRPKEHWFLTWIPLALIAALNIAAHQAQETPLR
ncbi:MAG: Lipid A core - O-antigen ligase [Candidatus Accumulibacter regalis]|jgi:O-Antigen ligase.|uniref:Lipid A core - O-antigen ligase n=2 Tax=Candidatus Accumulibacter TaxID=327159 RepID=A0A011QHM2_ACCRE|nr:MAG: Lipid A core - O-antigen ligase [Candidatus Accumulibacter regalis]